MDQTIRVGIGNMSSSWICICELVQRLVVVGVGKFWYIRARMSKSGQDWMGQTDQAAIGYMSIG